MPHLPSDPPKPHRDLLTAGDLARALCVDAKTVHNWVTRGLLTGTRTRGRHLRFQRIEVVRCLRQRGRRVPVGLQLHEPVVIAVGFERLPLPSAPAELCLNLAQAAVRFGQCHHDVLVINVDAFEIRAVTDLVSALRRHPTTRSRGLLGVSEWPVRRREFVNAGGDACASTLRGIEDALLELSGVPISETLPPTVRAVPRPSGIHRRSAVGSNVERSTG